MTAPDPVVLDRPAPSAARGADAMRPAMPAVAAPRRTPLAVVRQLERAWPIYVVAILLVLILF